jgi:hypothetical protein
MSGDIYEPIEIIFDLSELGYTFTLSESYAWTLIPLEDLKHCQKSGELSLSECDMLENHARPLSEENCELDGTTLYGSLALSYPILEYLFPNCNIYTSAQSRYLKGKISKHQKTHVYPIYSSGIIILVPIFLLFDSMQLKKLNQSDNSKLRSLRTLFDTFTLDQDDEVIDTMDDSLSR